MDPIKLLAGNGITQTFLNALFAARDLAVQKAQEALQWATQAAGSASTAGTHATNAGASASAAAGSASAAAGSASAAAASALAAKNSEEVAEEHAANAAGMSATAVFAQRVLAAPPIVDWHDLLVSPPSPALVLSTSLNASYDDSDHTIAVGVGNTDPWEFSARFDLTLDPERNPLYGATRLSYRLADLAGKLADTDGPTPAAVSLQLLNASLEVVREVPLGPWRGTGDAVVYEANNIVLPASARYVLLTISAQGGEGRFPVGHFAAGPFQDAGYLTSALAATLYRPRRRRRIVRALPYTLSPGDDAFLIELTGSGALTVAASTNALERTYTLLNASGGVVTVEAGAGLTIRHAGVGGTIKTNGTAEVTYGRSNEAWLSGDIS